MSLFGTSLPLVIPRLQRGFARVEAGDTIAFYETSSSAVTINLNGRFIADTGDYQDIGPISVATVGNLTRNVTRSPVFQSPGWITAAAVSYAPGSTTQRRGSIFVEVAIDRSTNGTTRQVLISDFLTGNSMPSFPFGLLRSSMEGPGVSVNATVSAPSAGADFANTTVSTNSMWLVTSFTASMVQGITQTPAPSLVIDDGTNILYQIPIGVVIAASTTVQCTWGLGLPATVNNTAGGSVAAGLPNVLLVAGSRIRTVTNGIGANSAWGAAKLTYVQWPMNVAAQ
jgi:hypothetical protein